MAKKVKSKILSARQDEALTVIKQKIKAKINAANSDNSLSVAINAFKFSLIESIKIASDKGKDSIIKSQEPIKLFHEVVKRELVKNGVNPSLIIPPLKTGSGEKKLYGFIKDKTQDVCVLPNNYKPKTEKISEGMLMGLEDPNGIQYTERILAINVRSQMSSIAKNDDTIGERTFAETINLHLRCPRMVLGELFILPVTGFNMDEVKKGIPAFEKIKYASNNSSRSKSTPEVIEGYINAFNFLNNRNYRKGEEYKYERVCLLIADFSKKPIKIYKTKKDLIDSKLLPKNSKCSYNDLNFSGFIKDLLKTYETRFGKGKFK